MDNYLKFNFEATRSGSEIITADASLEVWCTVEEKDFKISEDKYKPTHRDTLFFAPGVNIPRIKIKNLTLSHNIKAIRDINKADAIFINNLTFAKMVSSTHILAIPVKIFIDFIEVVKDELQLHQLNNIKVAMKAYDKEIVLIDARTKSAMIDDNIGIFYRQHSMCTTIKSAENKRFNVVKSDDVEIFNHLKVHRCFHEADVIGLLNGDDALTIDQKVFEQLRQMLNSTDVENHTLAMEIMANCEYQSSLLFLMMLFKEYHAAFMASGGSNHVNFKSLLSYMDLGPGSMTVTIDSMMAIFLKREVLTEEWVNIILGTYGEEVANGDSEYFKCKIMTLNEEALEYLNINYKVEMRPDFTPRIIEEVEEVVEGPPKITWI